jgi:hypothetical protein
MDQSNNETGFELQRETQQKGGSWRGTTTVALPIAGDSATGQTERWIDTPGAGTHRHRIRAANGSSYSAWTLWTQVTVTSTGSGCKGTRCR